MLRYQKRGKSSSLALALAVLALVVEINDGGQSIALDSTDLAQLSEAVPPVPAAVPASAIPASDAPAPMKENPAGGSAGPQGSVAAGDSGKGNVTEQAAHLPKVQLTIPNGGYYYAPATIPVFATVTVAPGATVHRVDFYGDSMLVGTVFSSPFTITWSSVAAGSYLLSAKVTDSIGNTAMSRDLPVTVQAKAPAFVSLTAPDNLSTYAAPASIPMAALASAATGGAVTKVEFFAGSTLVGTASSSPYATTWSNVPVGEYSLTALVTDSLGGTARSSDVSVSVVSRLPARIMITSPGSGISYRAPATIPITVAASASTGAAIKNVEFYASSRLVGTASAEPFSYVWSNVPAGRYYVIAAVTDSAWNFVTSSPVEITVTPEEPGSETVPSAPSGAVPGGGFMSNSGAMGSVGIENLSSLYPRLLPIPFLSFTRQSSDSF